MNLYDLETYIENCKFVSGEQKDDVLLHDVHFKRVMVEKDEHIFPPLEVLQGKADRELILARQRVYSEKKIERPLIFTKIKKNIAGEQETDSEESEQDIEYEDIGSVPEGAFFFRDHFPILHVGKSGRVIQLDLMKHATETAPSKALNKEFKNMLLTDIKEHDWDAITGIFLKNE